MGIPGFVGLLKSVGRQYWCSSHLLKNTKLIIDCTDGMGWFLKQNLLEGGAKGFHMDRFGFSMVELDKFMNHFFDILDQAKVKPIIVYNGARLSEKLHGERASKKIHLEKSCEIRMLLLNRYGERMNHDIFPYLATNVLKQVIQERQLECCPVQSVYEVYPKLVELAEQHDCPVMTSHSDFILSNVRRGFIWAEELKLPNAGSSASTAAASSSIPIQCLYQHSKFLDHYVRLAELSGNGVALKTLYALLRPDFSGQYDRQLNDLFQLHLNLRFVHDEGRFRQGGGRPNRQPCGKRLSHILENWPKQLSSVERVRSEIASLGNGSMLNDYDAIYRTFSEPLQFNTNDTARELNIIYEHHLLGENGLAGVEQALKKRESSAPFLLDTFMRQTIFDRGTLEDKTTYQSCFSILDSTIKLLMEEDNIADLEIFDRCRFKLRYRRLSSLGARDSHEINRHLPKSKNTTNKNNNNPNEDSKSSGSNDSAGRDKDSLNLKREKIYIRAYNFPSTAQTNEQIDAFLRETNFGKALTNEYSRQLLIMLLLIRYALKQALADSNDRKKYEDYIDPLYLSVYNVFFHHAHKTQDEHHMLNMENLNSILVHPHDQDQSFLPQIRMASNHIQLKPINTNPAINDVNFIEMKHLVEIVNTILHGYCELNSAFNYCCPQLKLGKYYDAVEVYKIMKYLKNRNVQRSSLLPLEEPLVNLLKS